MSDPEMSLQVRRSQTHKYEQTSADQSVSTHGVTSVSLLYSIKHPKFITGQFTKISKIIYEAISH
jgi:hypothetical protein